MNPGETLDGRGRGAAGAEDGDCEDRTAANRLERAFRAHLDRDAHADCARVVVHATEDARYEYVDGVHYVTGVGDAARERVEAFVAARDLDVVMDGLAGVAFRHDSPAADADAHVAGVVVKAAFDATYADLDDVVEVVDGATEVSWTELDGQPA